MQDWEIIQITIGDGDIIQMLPETKTALKYSHIKW